MKEIDTITPRQKDTNLPVQLSCTFGCPAGDSELVS